LTKVKSSSEKYWSICSKLNETGREREREGKKER